MPGRHGLVGKPGHQDPQGPPGPKRYPGRTEDVLNAQYML